MISSVIPRWSSLFYCNKKLVFSTSSAIQKHFILQMNSIYHLAVVLENEMLGHIVMQNRVHFTPLF